MNMKGKSDLIGKNAVINDWMKGLEAEELQEVRRFIRTCNEAFKQFGAQSAKELLFEILKTEIQRRRLYAPTRYPAKSIG
jgi:hypothetical protein